MTDKTSMTIKDIETPRQTGGQDESRVDSGISTTKNEDETPSDRKTLTKRLKKQRQREKKIISEASIDTKCEDGAKNCERERIVENANFYATPPNLKCKGDDDDDVAVVVVDDDRHDDENSESNDSDIDLTICAPAFVRSSIVNKKDVTEKRKQIRDTALLRDNVEEANSRPVETFLDKEDGFTPVKKGSKQAPGIFSKTPEGFGNQALKLIEMGDFPLAVNYLTRAVALDPVDPRHYVNRSFCHLRTGNYSEALRDIRYGGRSSGDITARIRTKRLEGKALLGLENYQAAEQAFRECEELEPDCAYVQRELRRVQLRQLVDMGFNERDAILALEKQPRTMDALNFLTNRSSVRTDLDENPESESDDEIFHSDSEECPSNERLLSIILNYDPSLPKERSLERSLFAEEAINNSKQRSRSGSAEPKLRVKRTTNSTGKPKAINQPINEMAIWVGSVTDQITDSMITKRFRAFGKVTQVWRSPVSSFCFVNFQSADSATKALEEASFNCGNIHINGNLMPIKRAAAKSARNAA